MQTKLWSWIEIISSTCFGFVVTLIAQIWLYPIYHIHVTFVTNMKLVFWMTVLSVIRGFAFRRIFNKIAIRMHYANSHKNMS